MWQLHNTTKLDAIREEIDRITNDEIEKSVLLTSLIFAMDKVDSSVGHHVSYLKKWAPRAYNTMKMVVPNFVIDENDHKVYPADIFDVLGDVEVDLAYYDPPYGSSNKLMPPSRVRYASYYHIWKTICLNDKPKIGGAANLEMDYKKNVMSTMSWTKEWLNGGNGDIKNKEYLFLVQRDEVVEAGTEFKIEQINMRERLAAGQQSLALS